MIRAALLASSVLFTFAYAGALRAQPVTGLYIGASGGGNWLLGQPSNDTATSGLSPSPAGSFHREYKTGFAALAEVGYGLGNGLRVELEMDERFNRQRRYGPFAPATLVAQGGSENKYGPMVNALYDIPLSLPVQPYVGAGVGYQWTRIHGYNTTTANKVTQVSYTGGTDGDFAYQAIVGGALPLSGLPGLSLTLEYRFLGLAGDRTFGGPALVSKSGIYGSTTLHTTNDYNNSVLLGLRFAFNPPAAAPQPVPVAVPVAPSAARTYLVFFDWDRAELTDRARQVVAEAARATTRVQVTRIEVNGYTDRSGAAPYNQGLSMRRAQSVASELVRLGVARGAISIRGYGETNPLVPTADGVREPQNRRVEIILRDRIPN